MGFGENKRAWMCLGGEGAPEKGVRGVQGGESV